MRERGLWGILCFLETLENQVFFGDHVDFFLTSGITKNDFLKILVHHRVILKSGPNLSYVKIVKYCQHTSVLLIWNKPRTAEAILL